MSGTASDETWRERAATSLALGWRLIAEALGQRTATWDEAWLADAASPNPFFNAATLRQPLGEGDAADLTARLDRFFAERPSAGSWVIWSAWPTQDLSALGYASWGEPPIMVREPGGAAPSPPPELEIVEAHGAETLAAIEHCFIAAYPALGLEGLPAGCAFPASLLGGPFRFWGGVVDGRIVSVSAALLTETHTDVFYVATHPDYRRRGYGAAVTWLATLADPSLPALLEATDDGRPVYEQMGFREIGRMSLWERPRDPANPVFSPYALAEH